MLDDPLPWLKDVVRVTRPSRLPVVMTPEEVRRVLSRMTGPAHLVALLLYGAKLQPDEDSEGDAVYAVASIANLSTMWDEIARRAELRLVEVKRKLATCRSGF